MQFLMNAYTPKFNPFTSQHHLMIVKPPLLIREFLEKDNKDYLDNLKLKSYNIRIPRKILMYIHQINIIESNESKDKINTVIEYKDIVLNHPFNLDDLFYHDYNRIPVVMNGVYKGEFVINDGKRC